MTEPANLVRPPHSWMNRTSTPSTSSRPNAASEIRRISSAPMAWKVISRSPSSNSDLDAPEARRGGAVPDACGLHGLALAAVRRPPQHPFLAARDRVARSPELGRDAGVVRIAVQLRALAVLDPPGHLAPELEVHTLVVDGPRLVREHEHPVLRVGDDLVQRPVPRFDRDVRHPDERKVLPSVGSHRGVRSS